MRNPRKAVKVPFIPRNPMNNDTPSLCWCVLVHTDIKRVYHYSSDYAELTEHSCSTDYARNLNGFGLTAIGLAH